VLVSVVIVEGGYRWFLWKQVNAERNRYDKAQPQPTLHFYGWPPPWRFDRKRGFAFNDGPWLAGNVVNGVFSACVKEGPGNRYGNFGPARGDYATAEVRIALFGSSYTLVDYESDGNTTTNLLQQKLAQRLGRSVHILNFSRDATGLLSMFDIAQDVAEQYRPHLMLFTFNTTALGYRRHWRVVKESAPGFYRMYFSLDASEQVDPARSIVHTNPITPRVTPQWCDEMEAARLRGDHARLRDDPLLKDIIAEHRAIVRERSVPRIALDFWDPRISFVYNQLKYGNPFHDMQMFAENTFWTPLALSSYANDAGFVEAVDRIRATNIPFYVVHVPMLQEMNASANYASGSSGLTDAQQASVLASVEELTGRRIIELARYYQAPLLENPLQLVASQSDSHPSPLGVVAMADALERLLVEHALIPATAPEAEADGSAAATPHEPARAGSR
jgi:hypothetical protein